MRKKTTVKVTLFVVASRLPEKVNIKMKLSKGNSRFAHAAEHIYTRLNSQVNVIDYKSLANLQLLNDGARRFDSVSVLPRPA